jgi:hypothetical protein
MLVGQGGDYSECEVRINGRRHEPSGEALAGLDWPRSDIFSLARTFVLLVGIAGEDADRHITAEEFAMIQFRMPRLGAVVRRA